MIRKATIKDSEILANIISKSFSNVAKRFSLTKENCPTHPSNCTTHWVESDIVRGVQYFILSVDGNPTGCVGLEIPNSEACYLERLSVLPELRGKGFGVFLVRYVLELAKTIKTPKVSIAIIDEQTELKEWYKYLGFNEIATKIFKHLPFQVCFMEFDFGKATNQPVVRGATIKNQITSKML